MPLAWVDEIAGLEPAINFLHGKGYTSKLWPYNGVEEQFLAYLPLQGWLHIVFQYILNFSIYQIRLPYALFLVIGGLLSLSAMKTQGILPLVSLMIVCIILNEKSLFETTRAVRVEPISFLLLSLALFGIAKSNKHIIASSLTLMLSLHPYLWPTALVLFIWIGIESSKINSSILTWLKPNVFWIYPIVLLIFFILFIEGDINLLISQLSAQFERHDASEGILTKISDHFITRFWPYYLTQPFIPILIYFTFFRSIYQISKQNSTLYDAMLIFTHLCWMLAIGPMHRYNSVLIILSFATLIPWLCTIRSADIKWKHYFLAGIIFAISTVDITARQVLARMQYQERNPSNFIAWLESNLPNTKSIITGHEIAYYEAVKNCELDFFLFNTEPYRFNFKDYNNLLLIHDTPLAHSEVISQYVVNKPSQPDWIKRSSSLTYNKLYLLRITEETEYRKILSNLKKKNTEKSNKEKYK